MRSSVTGADNVLGLALELGIPRCVYVSSTMYYGGSGPEVCGENYQRQMPCDSYYEQTKVEAHIIAQKYAQYGLPLIFVCPNAVVGANDYAPCGYFLRFYLNGLLRPYAWAPDMIMSHVRVNDAGEGLRSRPRKAGLARRTFWPANRSACAR